MVPPKAHQLLLIHLFELLAEYVNAAAARRFEAGEQVQTGGFSGTRGAYNREKAPRLEVEADAVQRVYVAVADTVYFFLNRARK